MTPKEKAKELVDKLFYTMNALRDGYNRDECKQAAKQCALIAVDEILSIKKEIWDNLADEYFIYWQQVKQEIEKL